MKITRETRAVAVEVAPDNQVVVRSPAADRVDLCLVQCEGGKVRTSVLRVSALEALAIADAIRAMTAVAIGPVAGRPHALLKAIPGAPAAS